MDKEFPCPQCKTTEHPKSTNKGHLCKVCASARAKKWYLDNPEKYFFNQIKAKYGITKEQYLTLVETQENKCAICNQAETTLNNWKEGEYKRLAIDHCHTTGKVRGLLCTRCNITLGAVKDNTALLIKMVDYLEKSDGC